MLTPSGAAASASAYRTSMSATRDTANFSTASSPTVLGQELEHLHREVVVGGVEAVAAGVGQGEHLRRSATASRAVGALLPGDEMASLHQHVEVATNGGRREPETFGQGDGRGRAVLQDRPRHPLARGLVRLPTVDG